MGILQHVLLPLTNFRSPLLRTAVPSVAAAFALQAFVAVPSVRARSERYYDASGSATFLAVTLLSLCLPPLRAAAAAPDVGWTGSWSSTWNWRQLALSAAAAAWAVRLGSYLFARVRAADDGHDSRFDGIRGSPVKFGAAFAAQAVWVSLVLMPVIAVNAAVVPAAGVRVQVTDVLGGALFLAGFACEIVADRQKSAWVARRRAKEHDEAFMTTGLWSRSQYPNYFGECALWTGIATVAAGALCSPAAQAALGFPGGGGGGGGGGVAVGKLLALGLSYVSPAFTSFLLLKVTGVPLSEPKYDARYGHREDYRQWKRNTPKFFPRLF
ncbi:hypothetical protein F5X96DRAFT_669363 [Biscogniauxia mediterranea]|nr:hypothetical protein F5X96DRAFT_669363 [Biscogniauxia mediterranea]